MLVIHECACHKRADLDRLAELGRCMDELGVMREAG